MLPFIPGKVHVYICAMQSGGVRLCVVRGHFCKACVLVLHIVCYTAISA